MHYLLKVLALIAPLCLLAKLPQQNPRQPPLKEDVDAGINVPEGFEAEIVHEGVGPARHLTVRHNGDIYARLSKVTDGGTIAALRDADGDGVYVVEYFGADTGTGIELTTTSTPAGTIEHLYYSTKTEVLRQEFGSDELVPAGPVETVVLGFPRQRAHTAKSLAFDDSGNLFVNSGAPSNACQEQQRVPGSPGVVNCQQLEKTGGIWVFESGQTGQKQRDGQRYATGLRHCVAIAWNPQTSKLYCVMHGRDQLDYLWPEYFTASDNAKLPAEEMHELTLGSNAGWPYTYWNGYANKRMLGPEYGGNGKRVWKPGQIKGLEGDQNFQDPILALPAHWAPNDLLFYTTEQFPERYRGGAFVAFHGSWNRTPYPQGGFNVVFVPFVDGKPRGDWKVFADGFPQMKEVKSPGKAVYRPCGLAIGPDGALYVSDSKQGRIWRIRYTGG